MGRGQRHKYSEYWREDLRHTLEEWTFKLWNLVRWKRGDCQLCDSFFSSSASYLLIDWLQYIYRKLSPVKFISRSTHFHVFPSLMLRASIIWLPYHGISGSHSCLVCYGAPSVQKLYIMLCVWDDELVCVWGQFLCLCFWVSETCQSVCMNLSSW